MPIHPSPRSGLGIPKVYAFFAILVCTILAPINLLVKVSAIAALALFTWKNKVFVGFDEVRLLAPTVGALRLVTIFAVAFSPHSLVVRALVLIFLSDLFDEARFFTNRANESSTYEYHVWDKLCDSVGYILGLWLLSRSGRPFPALLALAVLRLVAVAGFSAIPSSLWWVCVPDLTKELLVAAYIFGPGAVTAGVAVAVGVAKSGYEYHHHFVNNVRDFDKRRQPTRVKDICAA